MGEMWRFFPPSLPESAVTLISTQGARTEEPAEEEKEDEAGRDAMLARGGGG